MSRQKILIGACIILFLILHTLICFTDIYAKGNRQDDPSYQVDHNRTKNFSPTYHYLQENIDRVSDIFNGINFHEFYINEDLGDVTSKLIFGRTTGGNGEISYDGAQLGFNKSLYVPTYASGGNTYAIRFYQDETPQSYGIGMGPTATEGMVNYYAAYPWDTAGTASAGAVFGHRFYAGAYERLRITADGNIYIPGQVLINTTSFIGTEKLNVAGNAILTGTYTNLSLNTSDGTNFRLTNRYTGNRFSIDNSTLNTEIINFHSGGAVTIGATDPIGSEKLRVNGDQRLDGTLVIPDAGYIGSASDTDAMQIESDGDINLSGSNLTINSDLGDVTPKLIFGRTTGGNGEISWDGVKYGYTNQNIILNGYTTLARMYSGADSVFGHNIYSDTASRVLKQLNDSYYSAWVRIYYNEGISFGGRNVAGSAGDIVNDPAGTTNEYMRLNLVGQLLIGTTSPVSTEKLRVNGDIYGDGTASLGALILREKSSDPADPAEGQSVIWQSDGTGAGDDGDLMVKITAGGVTKTATLIDFSGI
jgi:hypothetical protein